MKSAKTILITFLVLSLFGCNANSEVTAVSSLWSKEKIWVFSQFNVRQETDGLESYYYYGQVSKKLYEAISKNEVSSGFILLENVKYWGQDDLIYDYKDRENRGDIVFRIENIVKISPVNVEPVPGMGVEQFQEPKATGSAL